MPQEMPKQTNSPYKIITGCGEPLDNKCNCVRSHVICPICAFINVTCSFLLFTFLLKYQWEKGKKTSETLVGKWPEQVSHRDTPCANSVSKTNSNWTPVTASQLWAAAEHLNRSHKWHFLKLWAQTLQCDCDKETWSSGREEAISSL